MGATARPRPRLNLARFATPSGSRRWPRFDGQSWRPASLALLGAGFGLSSFANGFYDLSLWGPATIALLLALLVCLLVLRVEPIRSFAPVLAGLAGLATWSTLSELWAESPDLALVEGDRWGLYAVIVGLLAVLVRRRRDAVALLGGTTASVLVVALWVVAQMLIGHRADLFLGGRLNQPLGYVNGEANLFLLGIWPLVALAEARRGAVVSGAAVAGATLLTALAALSQSRGVALAAVLSLVVLVAVVPHRQRRVWVMVTVIGALIAVSGPIFAVYQSAGSGLVPPPSDVRHAAVLMLLAAAAAGGIWALLDAILVQSRPAARVGRALLSVGAVALVVLAVIFGGRIADQARSQVNAFTHLGAPTGQSRFLSGAGTRYDYWRVAWQEFRSAPIVGLGGGNYGSDYFRERRTTEDIRQPHSIELQVMSELGVVGTALLLTFVVAVLVAFGRLCARARRDPPLSALAVAGGGAFVVWLAHTSVDWQHLFPGLTGIALAGAAVVVRPWGTEAEDRSVGRRLPLRAVALFVPLMALLAIDVARPTIASHVRTQASAVLATDPLGALRKANTAFSLDDGSLDSSYLQAAALARLADYPRARGVLLRAAHDHPNAYVPWALLGDLATRRGDGVQARAAYRQAARLDPTDPAVAALAR